MYDDNMSNVLVKYLEGVIQRQQSEIMQLEVDLDEAETYIERLHKMFEKQHDEHLTTNLAINIQAAEAEWRADDEKHKRIALLMRI